MFAHALYGCWHLTRGTGLPHSLNVGRSAAFPWTLLFCLILHFDFHNIMTKCRAGMLTCRQLVPAHLGTWWTLPKMAAVLLTLWMMAIWRFFARKITSRRFGDLFFPTRYCNFGGFTEASNIFGFSTWIAWASMTSTKALVITTA